MMNLHWHIIIIQSPWFTWRCSLGIAHLMGLDKQIMPVTTIRVKTEYFHCPRISLCSASVFLMFKDRNKTRARKIKWLSWGLHNQKVTNPTLNSSLLTHTQFFFFFSSSHVDRGAGDRTGRKKREGCWGGGKGWKFPEKRQGKSRGAEDEVIKGAANNYPKKWLKIFKKQHLLKQFLAIFYIITKHWSHHSVVIQGDLVHDWRPAGGSPVQDHNGHPQNDRAAWWRAGVRSALGLPRWH